jgi:hypothetical protein
MKSKIKIYHICRDVSVCKAGMGSNVAMLSFYAFFPITLINNLLQHEGEFHVSHNPVYVTNKM